MPRNRPELVEGVKMAGAIWHISRREYWIYRERIREVMYAFDGRGNPWRWFLFQRVDGKWEYIGDFRLQREAVEWARKMSELSAIGAGEMLGE